MSIFRYKIHGSYNTPYNKETFKKRDIVYSFE